MQITAVDCVEGDVHVVLMCSSCVLLLLDVGTIF